MNMSGMVVSKNKCGDEIKAEDDAGALSIRMKLDPNHFGKYGIIGYFWAENLHSQDRYIEAIKKEHDVENFDEFLKDVILKEMPGAGASYSKKYKNFGVLMSLDLYEKVMRRDFKSHGVD